MKKIALLTFTSFFVLIGNIEAQTTTTNSAPYNSTSYLVNNVLLGQGVSASNITFTGNANQIGFFNNGNSLIPSLGLDSGIVISSGDINDIPIGGDELDGGNSGALGVFNNSGDPDLLSIAQSVTSNPNASTIEVTSDAAILEFDFTPQGDSVKFNFVFASEEYPGEGTFGTSAGYINQQFNDIFAFFISGPGITGPYASPSAFPGGSLNIAKVPGTTDPITISTIYNDPGQAPLPTSLNGQYYISNSTQANNDFNGFTTVLSISFPLQCNETYHFKLAIADAGGSPAARDMVYDSGIFMEASSFSSESVQVNVVTATGDSTVIEGCADATLNFTRPDTLGDLTVHFAIGGNAINGVDYVQIADSITFLAGQDSAFLNINPIADLDFTEGEDTISITAFTINACGDTITSIGYIYILDLPNMLMNSHDTILDCPLTNLPIYVEASQALEPFIYEWFSDSINGVPIGINNDTIMVSGLVTDTFYVSVTDSCDLVTLSDTIIVTVNISQPEIDSTTVDSLIHCSEGISLDAYMVPATGTAPFTFSWNGVNGNPSPIFSPIGDTIIYVTVTDFCGLTDIDSVAITMDTIPITIDTHSNDTLIHCGESMILQASATNGVFIPLYNWTILNGGASPALIAPETTTTYIIEASGNCTVNAFDTVVVTVDTIPVTIDVTNDITHYCIGQTISIEATPSDGTSNYNYTWNPANTNPFNVSPSLTTTYYVLAEGGCNAFITDSVTVTVDYTPMSLSLTDTVHLKCPNIAYDVDIVATVLNGGYPYSYNWTSAPTESDSLLTILNVNNDQPVTLTVTDQCGSTKTETMYIEFDDYTNMLINTLPVDSVCLGEETSLSSTPTFGLPPYSYIWNDGVNSYTGSPVVYSSLIAGINNVTLTVTDQCMPTTDNVDVLVIPCAVNIPNVITPNGDFNNDFLVFENLEFFPSNNLQIFNRWGKKIYEKDGYQNDWYGEDFSEGTYFFILELNNFDKTLHKGTFTILK
jgi:gliding motility-associated-like protein